MKAYQVTLTHPVKFHVQLNRKNKKHRNKSRENDNDEQVYGQWSWSFRLITMILMRAHGHYQFLSVIHFLWMWIHTMKIVHTMPFVINSLSAFSSWKYLCMHSIFFLYFKKRAESTIQSNKKNDFFYQFSHWIVSWHIAYRLLKAWNVSLNFQENVWK